MNVEKCPNAGTREHHWVNSLALENAVIQTCEDRQLNNWYTTWSNNKVTCYDCVEPLKSILRKQSMLDCNKPT